MHQMVCKSELKRGSYACLNQIGQRRMLSLKFTMHFELSPTFRIGPPSTYVFKIDLRLTPISNAVIGNQV